MPYYDQQSALLDRGAFASKPILAREAQTVFALSWVLVAPAGWLAAPGAFYATYLGPDPVVAWRAPTGKLRVFANRCPLGVAPLARTTRGEAAAFVCDCHGRTYREGELERFGAASVECFKGLVFARQAGAGPSLEDELAPFRPYFEALTEGADVAFADGEPVRWRVRANWKAIVEAWCAPIDPAAAPEGEVGEAAPHPEGFQSATSAGVVAFQGDAAAVSDDDPLAGLTPVAGVLFPNLAFDPLAGALHICQPLSPRVTEVHSFELRAEPPARRARGASWLPVGPGGGPRGRQIAAWESLTAQSGGLLARRAKLNLQRGLQSERRTNLPGVRGDLFSETNARAFFAWWQARLDSPVAAPLGSVRGGQPAAPSRSV